MEVNNRFDALFDLTNFIGLPAALGLDQNLGHLPSSKGLEFSARSIRPFDGIIGFGWLKNLYSVPFEGANGRGVLGGFVFEQRMALCKF